ncbi:isotrichodermin C-15 hydroxylase [Purpureocillium lavendulum]|uniref:Isotrichodermin C-15 hydroxylase n=1 Tax=Purpureocillium lavendulum TaxID=1247861 RepID=A0AB34FR13_9HYPO|nr:isotrichodermin C-15 hydroxylase [Purpureocillium lavendulum]
MASTSQLRVFHYNAAPVAPAALITPPNSSRNAGATNIADDDHSNNNSHVEGALNRSRARPHPIPPSLASLPVFDTQFRAAELQFFFYHVVDATNASLHVHVLGPGLSFTFTHNRARRFLSAGRIAAGLHRKTTGFLALVRNTAPHESHTNISNVPPHLPSSSAAVSGDWTTASSNNGGSRRTVLAWAESGHGAGRAGDMLDAAQGALPNGSWTRRAVRLAALLGLRTDRPFDMMGVREGRLDARERERLRGVFLASHVEVKLATHGVFALLHVFGLYRAKKPRRRRRCQQQQQPLHHYHQQDSSSSPSSGRGVDAVDERDDGDAVDDETLTLATLARLRNARWDDGSKPRLEVYFSRRNCAPCGTFVRRLSEATGVRIDMIWRERLTRVVYETRDSGGPPRETNPATLMRTSAGPGAMAPPPPGDEDDMDLEDMQITTSDIEDENMAHADDRERRRQQQNDDVQVLDVVDLTGATTTTTPRCCIDLTGEASTAAAAAHPETWDLTADEEPRRQDGDGGAAVAGRRDIDEETRAAYMDAYLDGLAYCVGQLPRTTTTTTTIPLHGQHAAGATTAAAEHEEAWRAARIAVVDFAQRMLLLRRLRHDGAGGEGRGPLHHQGLHPQDERLKTAEGHARRHHGGSMSRVSMVGVPRREVNKPLPATPETHAPAWLTAGGVLGDEGDIWETGEEVDEEVSLSASDDGDIATAATRDLFGRPHGRGGGGEWRAVLMRTNPGGDAAAAAATRNDGDDEEWRAVLVRNNAVVGGQRRRTTANGDTRLRDARAAAATAVRGGRSAHGRVDVAMNRVAGRKRTWDDVRGC